ncbi:MAG TPA: furin-like repeat-containing protein [bacterium]|nr:furin-like repeat-containing protein [bacterium]
MKRLSVFFGLVAALSFALTGCFGDSGGLLTEGPGPTATCGEVGLPPCLNENCPEETILYEGICVSECPEGTTYVEDTNTCEKYEVDPECAADEVLLDGKCVKLVIRPIDLPSFGMLCPIGTVKVNGECTPIKIPIVPIRKFELQPEIDASKIDDRAPVKALDLRESCQVQQVRMTVKTAIFGKDAGTKDKFDVQVCKDNVDGTCKTFKGYKGTMADNMLVSFDLDNLNFAEAETWDDWTPADLRFYVFKVNSNDGWAIAGVKVEASCVGDEIGKSRVVYLNPVVNKTLDKNDNRMQKLYLSRNDTAVYLDVKTGSDGTDKDMYALFEFKEPLKDRFDVQMLTHQRDNAPHWLLWGGRHLLGDEYNITCVGEGCNTMKTIPWFEESPIYPLWFVWDVGKYDDFEKGNHDGYGAYFHNEDPIGRKVSIMKRGGDKEDSWAYDYIKVYVFKPGDRSFLDNVENLDACAMAGFPEGILTTGKNFHSTSSGVRDIDQKCKREGISFMMQDGKDVGL